MYCLYTSKSPQRLSDWCFLRSSVSMCCLCLPQQCNDVGLMAYLGSITKTCNSMNQFINKFNVLYDRQGIGRRMRGLFF